MSNLNFQVEILNFLFNKVFIKILLNKNFPAEIHNILLGIHLVTIGFNTTGISEGGTTIGYSRLISPIEEIFERPKMNFFLYNKKSINRKFILLF
ncbi:hypothetical protein GW820_05015 [archaeon]|nr:hypothetical protein [archaeon]